MHGQQNVKSLSRVAYVFEIQYSAPFMDPELSIVKFIPFISVINQPDAQMFFTISLFHASTCFEHMCSSSAGQNCITQPLVSSH